MKAVVFTLGCKVNECESDSIIAELISRGIETTDKLEYADIYIVNTCAVTKEAEKKSRQMVSRILKLNKDATIYFLGCACEKNPKSFIDKPNVKFVSGTFAKNQIVNSLDKSGIIKVEQHRDYEELFPVVSLKSRTFVKVQDGCDNFCSYCIVPYLRGRSRSRDPQMVKSEILSSSSQEIVINGINLSSYNYYGKTLADLMISLQDIDARIRLGSLEVNVIEDRFLTALKGLKNFAQHFHLSLQSGSNAVLKMMNRKYTREEFIEKCDLIRSYFPDAGITTDIIAGFPTETEADFLDTLSLIDRVQFSDIHPFIFSPREGTVAYKMQDLNPVIKKIRLDKLLIKKAECKENFVNKFIDKELDFLFEENKGGYSQGYSGNYLRLYVSDYKGEKIVKVKVKEKYLDGAKAQLL